MSDAIFGALGDVFGFLLNALTDPKAWLAAGLVFGALGRAAEVGDEVRVDGLNLRVNEIEGSRILKLEVEFTADDETPTDEPAAA